MRNTTIDAWSNDEFGVAYEVDIDDGFINAEEMDIRSDAKDVFAAMCPEDARRLGRALIMAADRVASHPRWQPGYDRDTPEA